MAEQTMDYDLKFDANTQKAIKKIDELSQKTHSLTDNEHVVKFGAKIDISDQAIQKVSAKIQRELKKTSVTPEITFDRIKLDEEKIKNSFASLRRQIQAAIKNQFSKIPPIDLTVNVSDSFKNLSKVASGLTQISNAAKGLSQTNIDKIKDFLTSLSGFNFSFNSSSFDKFISSLNSLNSIKINQNELSEIVRFIQTVGNTKITTDFSSLAGGIGALSRALNKLPSNSNIPYFATEINELIKLDSQIKNVNANSWGQFGKAILNIATAVKKIPATRGISSFAQSITQLVTAMQNINPQAAHSFYQTLDLLIRSLGVINVNPIQQLARSLRVLETALNRFSNIRTIDWRGIGTALISLRSTLRRTTQSIAPLLPSVDRLSNSMVNLRNALTGIGSVTRGFTAFLTQLERLSRMQISNNLVRNVTMLFDAFARGLQRLTNLQQLIRDLSSLIPQIVRLATYLRTCNNAINGLNRAIGGSRRNLDGFGNSARRAGEGFNFLTRSMQSTISDIRRVAAMVYVLQNTLNGLKAVAEQLDHLNVVKNKLRGLYEDEGKAVEVTDMIYRSAQDARTSMDAFSTTFLKVQLATEKYGFTAQEAVDMTNTLAKALTIGGATASETASVMLQMSQALSKGKLDGDEFRSVMENSPVLMRALAREAGKAMGVVGAGQKELMQWSRTGKLTIDILLNALKNMKGEMDRKFNGTTETITQTFAKLDNAWEMFIGHFAEEGALDSIKNLINTITETMEKWGRGIIDVTKWFSALLVGLIAGKAVFRMYNFATQQSINLQQSRMSLMTGEKTIQQQLNAHVAGYNRAMMEGNSITTKHEMIMQRMNTLRAEHARLLRFISINRRRLTADELAALQVQRAALGAEMQRVVAMRGQASAIRGLSAAWLSLRSAATTAATALGGLMRFVAGVAVLEGFLQLWMRLSEVLEQTERALNGNIDAIKRFGKGGDLEGWYEFLSILKEITGFDFGNLKKIPEGTANYLKQKARLKSKEEIEKEQESGVNYPTALGKVGKELPWYDWLMPSTQMLKIWGYGYGKTGEERAETSAAMARAMQDFVTKMWQKDAYFEAMAPEESKKEAVYTKFLGKGGEGTVFLDKATDLVSGLNNLGTLDQVISKEVLEGFNTALGEYSIVRQQIDSGEDIDTDLAERVVNNIKNLGNAFANLDTSKISQDFLQQMQGRIKPEEIGHYADTVAQVFKETAGKIDVSAVKIEEEIALLAKRAKDMADSLEGVSFDDAMKQLTSEYIANITGSQNPVDQIITDTQKQTKIENEKWVAEANKYVDDYARVNDQYVKNTKYWIDQFGNIMYGLVNDIKQSVRVSEQMLIKDSLFVHKGSLDELNKQTEQVIKDRKDQERGARKGGSGGGGHKDEFKIDWLNMVGLGGNIYDSYHPSKVLKTFEEAVPGGNRNLIGVDRDAEKWYEEVAKIKEQALEKGVKLTEQDYAELKALWDQRQELEKILDVKRQITDDINKPMEEYENQKKALEQLIAQMQALGRDTSLYEKKLRECRKPMEELGKAFAEGLQKNMLSDFGRDVFDRFKDLLEAWEKQEKKAADRPQIEKLMKQAQIEEFKLKASQKEGELTWGEGGKFWAANMGLRAENLGTLRAYNRGNLSQGAMASFMRDNLAKYNAYSGAFGRTEDGAGFLSSMGLDPNEWNDWALRGLEAVSKLTDGFNSLGESITESLGSALTTFTDGLADGIAGAIVKGEDLRETMNNVAQSILTNIISAIIKMGIQWAATQLMMSVIGDTMKKKEELTNAESAAVIASEWATAATYVSTATMGGAVAAGESALLTALATNQGLAFTGFADGGYTGNGDKYDPAGIVHKGEYVFTQDDVKRIGLNNLEMMHRGSDSVTNAGLNNNRASATEQRSSSVSIVNMVDPDMLKAYLSTPDGQRAIINTIRHNPKTVKQIVTTA